MSLTSASLAVGTLVPLLTLGASAAPRQDLTPELTRAVPQPHVTAEVEHDLSWYPYEQLPPFIGELVDKGEDSFEIIHAGSAVFTVDDPPTIPRDLQKSLFVDGNFAPGYFLVHFEAEIRPADKALLDQLTGPVQRTDGSPLSRWYVPNNTYAAWIGDAETLATLELDESIDWIGRYEPAYKLDPTIGTSALTSRDRVGRATYRLNLDMMPGHDFESVAGAAQTLGAQVLAVVDNRGQQTYDVRFLVVEAAPAIVTRLASIEGVRTIQESGDGLRMHDLSGGGKLQNRSLAADDQAQSPIVTSGSYPLWLTHDLQGQGQIVGVVDTSFDWNNAGTSGCGFGFPDSAIDNWGMALPNTARVALSTVSGGGVNLKIPRADTLGGATLQGASGGEHGAAVAGAACADFYGNNDNKWWEHDVDNWEGWAPSNFSGLLGPGIAHEAQLYATPVLDNNGGFRWETAGEFPTNMGITLTNMANTGVCATSHSVGLAESNNTYTQTSVAHDTEAFDNPSMLQCMAAGNDGAVANALTSQAVVKNSLTVGASDDVLKPEDRVTFSSIGPRFDGALKPDIMAPGNDTFARDGGVASALILPESNGTSSASCSYQYTQGTSFSAPTMTGASALVHQYYEEGRYPGTTPLSDASAALIKATLINAGTRLTGANLGNGQYPNEYQGWGEPNLSNVLDFGTAARNLIALDVSSANGFSSSGSANDVQTVTVDSSGETLKVTLVWTDEPGSSGQGKKLINDLDLIVTAPGGATYRGNVINGSTGVSTTGGSADTLNNVESVILNAPATGAWSVTVDPGPGNYSVGQGYALVVTGDVTEGGGGGNPDPPVADFSGTPTSGEAPLNVSFTSLSTGQIDTHSWTFGDGGTSNATNPSYTYNSPGTYDVSLTVTGPGGSDGETKNGYITVDPPPTGGGELWYLTFTSNTSVPGVGTVRDEDVVTYDPATGLWAMYFDGSDVGIGGTDINAMHVLSDGTLVMSFNSSSFSVAGLVGGPNGTTVEDSDLITFNFTSSGSSTSGSFSFVFDGSDVGLTTNGEDIDGIYEFPGGGLGISTTGGVNASGGTGNDEDVMLFNATQLGATTAGSFSRYFDGSDVGFGGSGSRDLNAVSFDDGVDLLFSTVGTYSAAGGSGNDEDISRFTGTFGNSTSGTAQLELDLTALGISSGEDVDGVCFR